MMASVKKKMSNSPFKNFHIRHREPVLPFRLVIQPSAHVQPLLTVSADLINTKTWIILEYGAHDLPAALQYFTKDSKRDIRQRQYET